MSNYALVLLLAALLVYTSIGFMNAVPAVEAETIASGAEIRFEPVLAAVSVKATRFEPHLFP